MYKIVILTTEGCEACEIAQRNIDIAVSQVSKEIQVKVKDWHEEKRDFIVKHKIKDFPTVIYFVGDCIVNKTVGTYPSAVYLRWIDMYFKN
jgi:hypothetical protein